MYASALLIQKNPGNTTDIKMVFGTGYAKDIFLILYFLFTHLNITLNDNCPISLTAAYAAAGYVNAPVDIMQSSIILHNRYLIFF